MADSADIGMTEREVLSLIRQKDRHYEKLKSEITKKQAAAFKKEIIAVCRKHGIGISHEDCHGAFLLEPMDEELERWFRQARVRNF